MKLRNEGFATFKIKAERMPNGKYSYIMVMKGKKNVPLNEDEMTSFTLVDAALRKASDRTLYSENCETDIETATYHGGYVIESYTDAPIVVNGTVCDDSIIDMINNYTDYCKERWG